MWQCHVNGFAGVRMIGTALNFNPRLPKEIEEISFNMMYQGQTLKVEVTKETICLTNLGTQAVTVVVKGEPVTLENGQAVTK